MSLFVGFADDGTEVFYQMSPDCRDRNLVGCEKFMMAVRIDFESDPPVGVPDELFEDPYFTGLCRQFDIGADGRFPMLKDVTEPLREINVVRN